MEEVMKALNIIAGLVFASVSTLSLAQGNTNTPKIDKREASQQQRIDQGKASGQLNEKEVARLQKRQDKLEANKAAAAADGKVTAQEREKLKRQENRNSREIYREKHDKQKAAPAPK
jgi:sortase (surface protein transpeptidase)